ncbi:lipase family protein [Flammeovirga sp. MY04]|uniref:lipase family protein n=1 Tax=Flammeovirga sp. MY04 TaxID=1191459 RepID=UPI0008063AA8|nr:lipase family protein [Flammeovirga sp. MY04]ANQ49862.1 lipase family protein [Flammeovirga sp. MY04]
MKKLKLKFDYKATKFTKSNLKCFAALSAYIYEDSTDFMDTVKYRIGKKSFEKKIIKDDKIGTQIVTYKLLKKKEDHIIITFRGSLELKDWWTNSKFNLTKIRDEVGNKLKGKVHNGFHQILQSLWPLLSDYLAKYPHARLWFTGHSLGGALAVLSAYKLCDTYMIKGIYTFGQPRIGNTKFMHHYNSMLFDKTFRVVHDKDIVVRIPTQSMSYSHVGDLIFIKGKGKVLKGNEKWSYWVTFWERVSVFLDEIRNLEMIEDHLISNYINAIFDSKKAMRKLQRQNQFVLRNSRIR